VLPHRSYEDDDQTELINLLVDEKEEGGGMYIAGLLIELSNLHN
jgi:hypothetical protein